MASFRYLASLLGGLSAAVPSFPADEEAWSWRRRDPWSPCLAMRHRDGSLVELRPLRPRERIQWREGMPELPVAGPPAPPGPGGLDDLGRRVGRLVALDAGRSFGWAVVVRESDGWWGVGHGVVVGVLDEPDVAEVAVAVHPDHRGRGIGRLLVRALAVSATVLGLHTLRVRVAPEEERVLAFVRGFGPTAVEEGGLLRCEAPLASVVASACCPEFAAELARLTREVEAAPTWPRASV